MIVSLQTFRLAESESQERSEAQLLEAVQESRQNQLELSLCYILPYLVIML